MKSSASNPSGSFLPPEARRFVVPMPEAPLVYPVEMTVTDSVTAHHLATVCRARAGERFALVDVLREAVYAATLLTLNRDTLAFRLDAKLETTAAETAGPHVTLLAALIKEQRWDALLQKTTELGVRAIAPVVAERSIVRLSDTDFERKKPRWESVLRAAVEQSEGVFIPGLRTPETLTSALKAFSAEAAMGEPPHPTPLKILLMERGAGRAPLKDLCRGLQADQRVIIAIGPEGGWTDGEAEAFEAAGFRAASLGNRILRSETAAMAAMAALMYESWAG